MRAVLLALLLAVPGMAQARAKIAVLDVKASGMVSTKQVEGLSSLIASEVSRGTSADVLSGADLRAVVGFDKQRSLLGCEEASCLAELGGALGADYIVGSEASQVGKTYLLSLSLVDIRTVKVLSRLTKQTKTEDDLVPAAQAAVHELLAPLPASLRSGASPAPEPVPVAAVSASPSGPRSKAPAFISWGAAVVAGGAGAFLLVDASGKSSDYKTGVVNGPTYTLSKSAAEDLKTSGTNERNIGWACVGGAALLAVLGVLLLPGDAPPPTSPGGTPLARF